MNNYIYIWLKPVHDVCNAQNLALITEVRKIVAEICKSTEKSIIPADAQRGCMIHAVPCPVQGNPGSNTGLSGAVL